MPRRVQQAELRVVDDLELLALLHAFDRQAQLLAQLIVDVVVEVGDAGVQADHRLHDVQLVLARRLVVVDEGALQLGLALAVGGDVDRRLAVLVVLDRARPVLLDERRRSSVRSSGDPSSSVAQAGAVEGQEDRRRERACRRRVAPVAAQRRLAEVVAVAVDRQAELLAVRVGRGDLDLAFHDDVELGAASPSP